MGLTWVSGEGSEVCPTVATLSTSVLLSLCALRGSPFGDLALDEIITCVTLLNGGMEYRETGRLHVAKQVAYSKLLGIRLNNHAACETDVENAFLTSNQTELIKLGRRSCLFFYFVTHKTNKLAVNSFREHRAAPQSQALSFMSCTSKSSFIGLIDHM